jgi:predicted nucleic acid-binding Zn ribbon protein
MQTCKTCGKSYDIAQANQDAPEWACKVCGSELIKAKTIKLSDDTVEESGIVRQVNRNTSESQGA